MRPAKITSGFSFSAACVIAFLQLPAWGHAAERASPQSFETKSWTWDDAITTAIAQHPRIRIAEQDVVSSEALVKQIESASYPQVTGLFANSAGNTRVLANLGISGSLPKPTNYLTTPGLRVDFLITDFGHTAHSILAQKALVRSAQQAMLASKALTILTVQQAYLNCLKQQRLVQVAREVLAERELIRRQTEIFYRRDLRSKLDLDFATVETTRAELTLVKAENDLEAAFALLGNAIGQPKPARPSQTSTPPLKASLASIDSLFQEALEQRPELLGGRDRQQAAAEALKAAKALRFGSVTAIGTAAYTWWGREERPSGKEISNPGAQLGWYGLGGTSALPLYTGGRISGQIEEAQARQREVDAGTQSLANQIVLQVAQAYFSRVTAQQQIAVAEERVAVAPAARTPARDRSKTGLGSILDVVTATSDLLAAEVGLAESQYELQASEAALAYATGAAYGRY
jgi:outer membrane protein TolC